MKKLVILAMFIGMNATASADCTADDVWMESLRKVQKAAANGYVQQKPQKYIEWSDIDEDVLDTTVIIKVKR